MLQGNEHAFLLGGILSQTKIRFDVFWKPVVKNLGGNFTKHHSPSHRKIMRPVYLQCPKILQSSSRVCYSNYNLKRTQAKSMTTGVYNST